jgi:hypothetical protein
MYAWRVWYFVNYGIISVIKKLRFNEQ